MATGAGRLGSLQRWGGEMGKFAAIASGALMLFFADQASATVLTFDDIGVPNGTFPSAFQGPIGFVEQDYQFSNNIDVKDVSNIANGPAFSGNYAAFNDYYKYGYGPEFTITKVGGGTFSFVDAYLQSWSHSASGAINVEIDGFLNGSYVGIAFGSNIGTWTDISAASGIGSFANIDKLVITPTDYALLDNVQLNNSVSAVPEPATWGMMLLGFVGLGFAAHRHARKQAMPGLA
jgi:hypothetical protein